MTTPSKPVVMVRKAPPTKPTPSPRPAVGWFPQSGDMPYMVKHDEVYRQNTLWYRFLNWVSNLVTPLKTILNLLKYTNETVVAREYVPPTGEVKVNGKVIVPLHKMREWVYHFEYMNTARVLAGWVNPGFGFCDTDAPNTDPYTDEVKMGVIDCGGNRRNGKGVVTWKGTKYVVTQTQNYYAGPSLDITYANNPQLCEKQVDVGDVGNGIFWRTADIGDVIWFWMSHKPVVHEYANCVFYPDLPFECQLFGFSVRVVEYCFTGSDTWVRVDSGELEPGWYQADGMNVPPDRVEPTPGTYKDYFCNISGVKWPQVTPPIANWQKD